jgi:lipopolysaccharide biosynthesis protein
MTTMTYQPHDPKLGKVHLIAFYLPQFHPIPENDEWWGKGFTEWRNVVRTKPLFPGHYQPHLPADLGFYDLRIAEVRQAQADLAQEYGIYGFCYYHYWFNGRRILDRPLNEVLASGKPNFPFCLCWANEDWTRAWDGRTGHTLLTQLYSTEDDQRHIESLIPVLRDERYIRICGKPLLLVYRTELLPNPHQTAEIWRDAARRTGTGDLYLVRVESFVRNIDPHSIGFDAAVEFAPDWEAVEVAGKNEFCSSFWSFMVTTKSFSNAYRKHLIIDYQRLCDRMTSKPVPTYKRFPGITPSWDNSPRRVKEAVILHDSTPKKYGAWLQTAIQRTLLNLDRDERIVFINAWNEWGEGNHLEPDQKWGRAYLEATKRAVASWSFS